MRKRQWINEYILILLAAFLVGGFLHVALWGVNFTTCIVQIFYGSALCIWSWTVRIRIFDRRVCLSLLGIGLLSVLLFMLQTGKYALFQTSAFLCRMLWYGFYVPMIGIPILLLFMALYMDLPEEEPADKRFYFLVVPGVLLMLGFLTNDLHGLAFFSPGSVVDEKNCTHGILYYLYVAFVVLVSLAAFVIILRKCRLSTARKRSWMIAAVLFVGVAGLASALFGVQPRIRGIKIWQMAEIYVFMSVLTLETCIHIGLIPCNVGYDRLFRNMSLPIEIRDRSGNCVIGTAEALEETEHVWIRSMPIGGGDVSWSVDMTRVYELNAELEEATNQIVSRNQYLQTENSIKEEQAILDARNRLYQKISQIVSPQLEKIETLLNDEHSEEFPKRLAKIAVLNAYVKRRSHMELLREEGALLSLDELRLAISESAQYLKLCGIDVVLGAFATKEMSPGVIVLLYEFFETVAEQCPEHASAMIVSVRAEAQTVTLRMLIQAETFSLNVPTLGEKEGCETKLTITNQGADTVIAFSVTEGGAA